MLRLSSVFVRLLPLAGLAVAAPSALNPLRRQAARTEACAEISKAYEEAQSNDTIAEVKPSLAYECLRSVPIDVERDVALVKYLRPWLEFQSTIGILPDPPGEYLYPGVDIFAGLDNITSRLEDGDYESQLDFADDLYRLINVKPRDGHLAYAPRLGTLIQFKNPELFISISEDGVKAPKVFLYSDYLRSVEQGYAPSEVAKFDTATITDYLQQRSVDNSRDQDPDAAYNEQLFSAAMKNVGELSGAGVYLHTTLADESEVEFANGTRKTIANSAFVISNFSRVTSGDDVHRRFEVPGPDGDAEVPVDATRASFSPALEGYPEPFVVHRDRYVSGHLLNGSAFEQTAVLAVNSFASQDRRRRSGLDDAVEFIRVNTEFVEASRKQGKSKLIVDLQGNGGGLVANAMSLYATLFPKGGDAAHMNMRVRAHPALDWAGTTAEKLGADLRALPYPVGYDGFVDEDLQNFTAWEDFYGPAKISGREEEYTNVVQPLEVAYAADGVPGVLEIPEPWFEPGNAVVVTDGHCASACAYVVAMGGRPLDAPMQAVGGTKGGPVISLGPYQTVYPALAAFAEPPDGVDVTPFADGAPPLAGPPTDSWTVNSANVYLDDDPDGVPAQFRYEAANCKLYYTWDTLTDMTRLWEAVASVKWQGARCVKGSTTNDDDTIGTTTPGYSDKVVSNFKWTPGPGDVAERSRGNDDSNGGAGGDGSSGEYENSAGNLKASWSVMMAVALATVLMSIS